MIGQLIDINLTLWSFFHSTLKPGAYEYFLKSGDFHFYLWDVPKIDCDVTS